MLGARMKPIALATALAASLVIAADAAQRIITNPADPHLKRLFPAAAAFSPHAGSPLHYKVYGVDPKTQADPPPIGLAFWTTDVVPKEFGYHGPIHLFVGLDMTGIIVGVIADYNSEPYGFFSVDPPEFAAQFTGKSIRAPFRVGDDIHAVSRATITITSAARAVRDSSRAMARQFLNPALVKE
jgi:transcriptional regulator of nitric oxide reductase